MITSSQAKQDKKKTQTTNIRNEIRVIITDPVDFKRIIKEYSEQFYAPKFDTLGEMDQFLERHNLPKLTQGEIDNRPISIKETESVISKLPK